MSIAKSRYSKSAEDTEKLAEAIGRALKGGEVIELVSDLGGGKTTFVRGLVRGAESKAHVASPSFTLSRVYPAPKLNIYHFDFYRLDEPGIMQAELDEVLSEPGNAVVIEWADVVAHVLPEDRLTVTIKQTPEGDRQLAFVCPAHLKYLLVGLN